MIWVKRIAIFIGILLMLISSFFVFAVIKFKVNHFKIILNGNNVKLLKENMEIKIEYKTKIGYVESIKENSAVVRINPLMKVCSDDLVWKVKEKRGQVFVNMDFKGKSKDEDVPCASMLQDGLTYPLEKD